MGESTLEWKYWDHVNNCWQYVDLDDLYGESGWSRKDRKFQSVIYLNFKILNFKTFKF